MKSNHVYFCFPANKPKYSRFRIALDMEQCLDRFYGGYFSDWACGGQWNRALQFVQLLSNAFNTAQIEVIAFFDGTMKENKRLQIERNDFRQKALSVLKHIRIISTPPPKVWWLPPSGVRTTLRNALRTVNIQVVQTVHDHTMEIIDYFRENKLNAVIGLHPDYILANISRYFSSHDLRLSYKGALETKEFMVGRIFVSLKLTPDQLAILAVLLGGYILLEEPQLREIYKKINVEYNSDFETRIRRLAEVIQRAPNTVKEFIKQLDLTKYETELKESIEYYQRRGAFSGKRYLGSKKKTILAEKEQTKAVAPMASETKEDDEAAKKILKDATEEVKDVPKKVEKSVKFVYTLPGEVTRTALQRHQRGIMDPRIYTILARKEILLPQVLEDEQYREIPSVHIFYRPARQMVYAILFNLYHQKYMHSKSADTDSPDVIINEWIWSPKNEYKTPDKVSAVQMNWAVPTIQRLWFGMAFEDKQRRMKAFLTVMRSDTPLMLNRSYVPQHLLILASVLRYIVANPDRNVINRLELDAFLATAFSPYLMNVEYTQEMVLPNVHLRGVYLATLFMQGVETAQLANDACGVPVPWSMTNPWLFFDGKIFHLKLRMAQFATSLRDLCDDQIDVMIKIERFRAAVLEDIEHLLLPTPASDPLFNRGFFQQSSLHPQLYKNYSLPLQNNLLFSGLGAGASGGNNSNSSYGYPSQYYDRLLNDYGVDYDTNDYQLRVGGVVVGSWAANRGGRNSRNLGGGRQQAQRRTAKSSSQNKSQLKLAKNRKNKNSKKKKQTASTQETEKVIKIKKNDDEEVSATTSGTTENNDTNDQVNDMTEDIKNLTLNSEPQTNGDTQNG